MNKDIHLIFEAYKKKLMENAEGTLIPSDSEIQAALEKYNSKCSVQDVKDAIIQVIERYKPTDADDLKNGLYEEHQDISNHQIGVGKQRFPYKEYSVAEVAVHLANTKRMWNSMKERNARGENAEEANKTLTANDIHRIVEDAFKTKGEESRHYPGIVGIYSSAIYSVLDDKGYSYFDSKVQDAVSAYEDHCLQAHEEYGESHSDRGPSLTHAQDPETGVLWYNWGGESYYNSAAVNAAFELAHKEGLSKVIINGLS